MNTLQRIGPYAGIAALAFLAYGSVLWSDGLSGMDDSAAIQTSCCSLRPVLALSYQVNRMIGGWMLTNLALHTLCAIMVYRISASFWAGGLFAVHPMAADSVASLAGRSALLAACVVFAGILLTRHSKRFVSCAGILIGLILGMTPRMLWNAMDGTGFFGHMAHFLSAVTVYILPNMIAPLWLSADPDIAFHPGLALAGLGLLVLAGGLAWKKPNLRLGIGLLILPLMPYALFPLPDVWLDHRGYVSIAGMAILAVQAAPRATVPAFAALMLVLSLGRAGVYATPMTLWADAAAKAPLKPRVHQNYGTALGLAGDYVRAQQEYSKAIELDPQLGIAYRSKAAVYLFGQDRSVPVLETGRMLPGNFAEASRLLDEYSHIRKEGK